MKTIAIKLTKLILVFIILICSLIIIGTITRGAFGLVKVKGNSMAETPYGSYLLIWPNSTPEEGDIVIATLNEEIIVKKFTGGVLCSTNSGETYKANSIRGRVLAVFFPLVNPKEEEAQNLKAMEGAEKLFATAKKPPLTSPLEIEMAKRGLEPFDLGRLVIESSEGDDHERLRTRGEWESKKTNGWIEITIPETLEFQTGSDAVIILTTKNNVKITGGKITQYNKKARIETRIGDTIRINSKEKLFLTSVKIFCRPKTIT
jgi:hypothetical protein